MGTAANFFAFFYYHDCHVIKNIYNNSRTPKPCFTLGPMTHYHGILNFAHF